MSQSSSLSVNDLPLNALVLYTSSRDTPYIMPAPVVAVNVTSSARADAGSAARITSTSANWSLVRWWWFIAPKVSRPDSEHKRHRVSGPLEPAEQGNGVAEL